MMKLFYLQGACPLVPHTALHWAKAEFEPVHVERGEQKNPEFLALNPQGKVPLLIDGDFKLAQNVAILEYLNEKFPQANIFGSGNAQQKALTRQWLALANSDLHSGAISKTFAALGVENEQAKQVLREMGIAAMKAIYAQADEVLAHQPYLTGNEITIADVYFYVTQLWLPRLDVKFDKFKNLAAHFERVQNNAGVQAALKDQGLI
ncbi:glutathione S-transferase family protein [Kingella negevensis]|uniref:glutathione S-transferase family protein n=1 Tax=Kingella negevensis TaxID=1522312 RepID=UPI0025432975|nr:glutathione S-transferase family protein [Kingella negevensis]MDK4680973.1 glutathione S-transferase family protein [Kingella negevensis]MDK4683175.1 glutathione S-transferase family protein [Kingella negevensis]MDK4691693.1 glutathione S-transferase family protein [Kingella negevensis]MDK4693155.1 glutathione S-transferase family protein [Kingella negevensis]MDK4699456.1 glutathione S-transferase family protein [Kingella negevensis]